MQCRYVRFKVTLHTRRNLFTLVCHALVHLFPCKSACTNRISRIASIRARDLHCTVKQGNLHDKEDLRMCVRLAIEIAFIYSRSWEWGLSQWGTLSINNYINCLQSIDFTTRLSIPRNNRFLMEFLIGISFQLFL